MLEGEIDLTHANLAWMADVILKQMYLVYFAFG